jgi:L-fucose isomerase-like protein
MLSKSQQHRPNSLAASTVQTLLFVLRARAVVVLVALLVTFSPMAPAFLTTNNLAILCKHVAISAIQCWSSMQKNFGVNVCTIMSMMSEQIMPSACEVDIAGVVSMCALQLASGRPSALVDWNNNYGGEPDKCVLFHCGNWAKDFPPDIRIGTAPILGTMLGEENTVGALAGRTPTGPMSFSRVSTDDGSGKIRAFFGDGSFTDDTLETFGTKAVVQISKLQELMQFIRLNGFEHHAAMTSSHCAAAAAEALGKYLGWDVYRHGCE